MLEQLGPQKLVEQLKAQAPQYAKLLPDLPRLVHAYLRNGAQADKETLRALLDEQRRTNRLLQALLYGGLGFVLGLVVLQMMLRFRLF